MRAQTKEEMWGEYLAEENLIEWRFLFWWAAFPGGAYNSVLQGLL